MIDDFIVALFMLYVIPHEASCAPRQVHNSTQRADAGEGNQMTKGSNDEGWSFQFGPLLDSKPQGSG
jgi:hypothetical protein